ncbi:hypothetical protein LJC56_03070 [Christensenellaceae bacterium OttesenSCG-928-K19]|nr:hypothetical protein [Christensenellaceae bacterium OttesenSCG-928-K19]
MKRLYVVTMEDGSRWGVPAEIIAKHRAEYYASVDTDTTYQNEYDLMLHWFDEGDYEFADWPKNNMNWSDVKERAVQMPNESKDVDWEEGWINGEYEFIVESEA